MCKAKKYKLPLKTNENQHYHSKDAKLKSNLKPLRKKKGSKVLWACKTHF